MERNGVLIDAPLLAAQSQRARRAHAWSSSRRRYELAGQPFNLGSPKQIGEILFSKLELPVDQEDARAARRRTDEDVLAEARRRLSAAGQAASSTAACPSSSAPTPTSCRRWSTRAPAACTRTYAQAVAVTGRLSSNDPNLQNIPIRTAEGRRIREAFIAPPGHAIIVGRLLADRAAHHGAHLAATRRCCSAFARRQRRAPRDRRRSLRRRRRTR